MGGASGCAKALFDLSKLPTLFLEAKDVGDFAHDFVGEVTNPTVGKFERLSKRLFQHTLGDPESDGPLLNLHPLVFQSVQQLF